MNIPTLCPACLDQLPDDYPFDHVAIDQALDSRPELFKTMTHAERKELVKTGLDRGMNLNQIAVRVGRTHADITELAPEDVLSAKAERTAQLDAEVARRYKAGHADIRIAAAIGAHPKTVYNSRIRQGLPSLYGPDGRRKQVAA